jgi:hypothetical protein
MDDLRSWLITYTIRPMRRAESFLRPALLAASVARRDLKLTSLYGYIMTTAAASAVKSWLKHFDSNSNVQTLKFI